GAADDQPREPRPGVRPRLRPERQTRDAHRVRTLEFVRLRRYERHAAVQALPRRRRLIRPAAPPRPGGAVVLSTPRPRDGRRAAVGRRPARSGRTGYHLAVRHTLPRGRRAKAAVIAAFGTPVIASLGRTWRWHETGTEHLDRILASG